MLAAVAAVVGTLAFTEAALTMLGQSREALIGEHIHDVIHLGCSACTRHCPRAG